MNYLEGVGVVRRIRVDVLKFLESEQEPLNNKQERSQGLKSVTPFISVIDRFQWGNPTFTKCHK